jgi:hypothetical protein
MNEIIIKAILEHIPVNTKSANYIMEILEISRESAYRRIRNEVPFTFEEVRKLSWALHFSIDELIDGSKKETFSFDLQSKAIGLPSNPYVAQYYEYNRYLQRSIQDKNSEMYMLLNEFPPIIWTFSEELFKFNYYQWLHTNSAKHIPNSLSDMTLLPELLALREQSVNHLMQLNNVTMIVSPYIYLMVIKSIQYYYQRKLLTVEDLLLLKNAMMDFINLSELLAKNGYFNQDSKVDFYLSSSNINSNSLFVKYDNVYETHFWIYPNDPLIIKDQEICALHKERILSLRKQSMLITLSNEIVQADYYAKQREYIDEYLTGDSTFTYGY